MRILWVLIIVSIVLKLLLMPITYHSDIQPFDLAGYLFRNGVGLDFYDYLPRQSAESRILKVYPSNLFNYPPAVYFFLGGVDNLATIVTSIEVRERFIFDVKNSFGDWRVNLHLFLLKLVYVPFDVGIALILWKMTEKKYKLWVLGLWLLNPVVIFGIYMMGQFDVIPAFLTMFAVYWLKNRSDRKAIWVAAIILGIGAAFKIYPLLLLPVIAGFRSSVWQKAGLIMVGFGVYVMAILPFIFSGGFRATALVAGQTTKSLYAQIPLSGGESVIIYIAALVFVYLMFMVYQTTIQNMTSRMTIVLLIFFALTHFHPQWFLWIVPFLILDLVESKFRSLWPLIVIVLSWFGSLWFFDSGMTIGMFSPVWPDLYNSLSVWQLAGISPDVNFFRSILASIFFGAIVAILTLIAIRSWGKRELSR